MPESVGKKRPSRSKHRKVAPWLRRVILAAHLRDKKLASLPGFKPALTSAERIAEMTGLSTATIYSVIRHRFGIALTKNGKPYAKNVWRRLANTRKYDVDREARVMHPAAADRPKTRGDCKDGPRPCPWAGCRYHLWLNAVQSSLFFRHSSDVDALLAMRETCALDVADRDGVPHKELSDLLAINEETVRLQLNAAMLSLRRKMASSRSFLDHRIAADDGEKLTRKRN